MINFNIFLPTGIKELIIAPIDPPRANAYIPTKIKANNKNKIKPRIMNPYVNIPVEIPSSSKLIFLIKLK
jgi:hypothetical protein